MPSRRPNPHWLSGVENILKADTHDLRALAELAGLDARTMYIGTRMDGADLRGQDLRGVAFTHLDRTTVRTDDKTRLDGDYQDEQEQSKISALVLVLHEELEAELIRRSNSFPFEIQLFNASRVRQFWEKCEGFSGPKLVLAASSDNIPSFEQHPPSKRHDIVLIVGIDSRLRGAPKLDTGDQYTSTIPVLLVPQLLYGAAGRRANVLSTPFRDLMGYAVWEWPRFFKSVSDHGVSSFLAVRADKRPNWDSTLFRLYARAIRSGFAPERGELIEVDRQNSREHSSAELLFPGLNTSQVHPISGWPTFDAAVILEGWSDEHYWDLGYESVVDRVLRGNGWRVNEVKRRGINQADIEIVGDQLTLDLNISPMEPFPSGLLTDGLGTTIESGRLYVSEEAEPSKILFVSDRSRTLLVNLQDLRWLRSTHTSLWPLVAHQARRVSDSVSTRSKASYFMALIRTAISRDRIHISGAQDLVGAVQHGDLGATYKIRVNTIGFDSNRAIFDVGLFGSIGNNYEFGYKFALGIDPDGPFIQTRLQGGVVDYFYRTPSQIGAS